MKRAEAILDWFIILIFPLSLWGFWLTDSTALLRFCAMLWVISVTVSCGTDRYKAHLERKLQRLQP